MIGKINGYIFDLDGTIYTGEELLPGAAQVIAELRGLGKPILFISNKPLAAREAYAEKLTGLGIPTSPEEVLTSAYILGRHLFQTSPHLRLYVIGEEKLRSELRRFGLNIVEDSWEQDPTQVIETSGIDAVIAAFDRTLDYRKINTAYQALLRGARFFATNADKACPMPNGTIPDAGATIAALQYLTGRKVELLAGKPSPLMIEVALATLELPAFECLLVGDRMETDIRMGLEAGMRTALVLTGVSTRSDLESTNYKPDIVLNDLWEMSRFTRDVTAKDFGS
jgi:arabinose operon protein AraL